MQLNTEVQQPDWTGSNWTDGGWHAFEVQAFTSFVLTLLYPLLSMMVQTTKVASKRRELYMLQVYFLSSGIVYVKSDD